MGAVVPVETPETEYLWQGYRRHELPVQECLACGRLRFLPAQHCADCSSDRWRARPATGAGTVFSFVITRRPEGLPVTDEFPVIAIVELSEGVRLVSNITGIPPEQVRIGLPVEAYFDDIGDGVTLVRFRPATAGSR